MSLPSSSLALPKRRHIRLNVDSRHLHLIVHATQPTATNDHDIRRIIWHNHQGPCVARIDRNFHYSPRTSSKVMVEVQLRSGPVRNDNRTQRTARRRPNIVRRTVRDGPISGNERRIRLRTKCPRIPRDAIVNREVPFDCSVELKGHDPVTERQLADDGHSGTEFVVGVDDVVDDGAPVLEVCGCLVHHLLAEGVVGVALVGVVEDELVGVG